MQTRVASRSRDANNNRNVSKSRNVSRSKDASKAGTPTAASTLTTAGGQQQQNTQEDASLVCNSMSLFVFLGYTIEILSEKPCTSDFPKCLLRRHIIRYSCDDVFANNDVIHTRHSLRYRHHRLSAPPPLSETGRLIIKEKEGTINGGGGGAVATFLPLALLSENSVCLSETKNTLRSTVSYSSFLFKGTV